MTPYLLTNATLDFAQMDPVGSGGEGTVYKSYDPQLNRIVAIKKIPIISFSRADDYFLEAQKVFHSKHHNVVEIFYGCKTADSVCIAMPYFAKSSLKSLLDQRNLTVKEIVRYSLQFLSGLNNIHSKGVFHFDLKPENILLSDADVAVISDFGLAKFIRRSGTSPISGVTPVTAPPETYTQAEHTVRFDVYQAGLTMYRMCNTESRFHEQQQRVILGASDPNRALKDAIEAAAFPNRDFFLPHISLPLKKIIKQAIALNPADRYSSVFEMMNALCKIDKTHDWGLTDSVADETWRRDRDEVKVTKVGSNWDVVAKRNDRRKTAYCGTGLDEKAKKSLLSSCFKEWDEEKGD
jgi:serine/threonine protein kinase